jgi:hypothetical protein
MFMGVNDNLKTADFPAITRKTDIHSNVIYL